MRYSVALVMLLALMIGGCAKKRHTPPVAAAVKIGWTEEGIASWYGHPYHGRQASNGEIYDMEKMTAAHRTLPFGTVVRVYNLENNHTVEVRINDRGPFVDGRIIDLSRAAAREIQMLGPGTAKVRLQVIAMPEVPEGYYAVQVGAFRDRSNAERQREKLARRFGNARLVSRADTPELWRVVVGQEASSEQAAELAATLRTEFGPAFVVRVDARNGN